MVEQIATTSSDLLDRITEYEASLVQQSMVVDHDWWTVQRGNDQVHRQLLDV